MYMYVCIMYYVYMYIYLQPAGPEGPGEEAGAGEVLCDIIILLCIVHCVALYYYNAIREMLNEQLERMEDSKRCDGIDGIRISTVSLLCCDVVHAACI